MIKRYNAPRGTTLSESDNGELVMAADHEAAIDALRTQVAELRAENAKLRQEQGERQEAAPEETPHIIVFDDADRPNEVFSGAGARPAALRRWEQISVSWNAHLFVRVEKNSRDDPNPCASLATTPQPGQDVRGLAAFALELINGAWEGASFDGGDIQKAGVCHGLLAVEQRDESCGEHCACAEYEFPAECYRLTPGLAAHRQAQQGDSHDT